jgi:hypothetical protein
LLHGIPDRQLDQLGLDRVAEPPHDFSIDGFVLAAYPSFSIPVVGLHRRSGSEADDEELGTHRFGRAGPCIFPGTDHDPFARPRIEHAASVLDPQQAL